jgi:hypothetical protein
MRRASVPEAPAPYVMRGRMREWPWRAKNLFTIWGASGIHPTMKAREPVRGFAQRRAAPRDSTASVARRPWQRQAIANSRLKALCFRSLCTNRSGAPRGCNKLRSTWQAGMKSRTGSKNLFAILLRSTGSLRAVLAMLTYSTYAALVLASPWGLRSATGRLPSLATDREQVLRNSLQTDTSCPHPSLRATSLRPGPARSGMHEPATRKPHTPTPLGEGKSWLPKNRADTR